MIRKGLIVMAVLIVTALSSIYARPEFWLGAGLRYDMNMISPDWKQYFPAYNEGKISFINSAGLNANFICFYSPDLRLGLFASLDMLFPVGFVADSGATEGFISYKFDYRMDLSAAGSLYCFKISSYRTPTSSPAFMEISISLRTDSLPVSIRNFSL